MSAVDVIKLWSGDGPNASSSEKKENFKFGRWNKLCVSRKSLKRSGGL